MKCMIIREETEDAYNPNGYGLTQYFCEECQRLKRRLKKKGKTICKHRTKMRRIIPISKKY